MTDGIYKKFNVNRTDGTDVTGADFFVLRLDDGDQHALAAALAYANSCWRENPDLASGLFNKVAFYKERKAGEPR